MKNPHCSLAKIANILWIMIFFAASITVAQTNQNKVEVTKGISVSVPESWVPGPLKFRNAVHLVTPAKGPLQASTMVTTELGRSHAEALRRVSEIAFEAQANQNYLNIGGWPAVETRYMAPLPKPGARGQAASHSNPVAKGVQLSLRVSTAVAAGNQVLRVYTTLMPGADPKLADQAIAIGRSTTFPVRGVPAEVQREISDLRTRPRPTPAQPRSLPSLPIAPITGRKVTPPKPGPVPVPGDVSVQGGNGELEIAVSNNGQNVVIAANSGYSFSNNGGGNFTNGGTLDAVVNFPHDGDPSLALGASGAFYLDFLGAPDGSPAAGGVTGCSVSTSISKDNGASFNFLSHDVLCTYPGATACFPDQEHIAADRANAGGGGDQIYAVWRNFAITPPPSAACPDAPATIGAPTASIVCSQDGGITWGNQQVIDANSDFPRVTVGADGFVYVVYLAAAQNGSNLMIQRYQPCSASLTPDNGPVLITSLAPFSCPVPGLDRCDGFSGTTLASPTVAVDDTNPSHIYVAYADRNGAGNEDIFVTDSPDGGMSWTNTFIVNAPVPGRRFMPWVCSVAGAAVVSWYDRRAVNPSTTPDLTDYYVGGVFPYLGSMDTFEWSVSNHPDPQCATGFPCGAPDASFYSSCNLSPGLIDRGCPKYGDYNGVACGPGAFYNAWTSATAPPGLPPPSGLDIYANSRTGGGPIEGIGLFGQLLFPEFLWEFGSLFVGSAPVVGSGGLYQTETQQASVLSEMTVVGKETVGGKEAYWIEGGRNDLGSNDASYAKVLITKDDFQFHRMIIQRGQQVIELPVKPSPSQKSRVNGGTAKWNKVGSASITVPAGTFTCDHWTQAGSKNEIWINPKISPVGIVKEVSPGSTMVLVKVITGAKDHITGTPKKLDPRQMVEQVTK